MGDASKVLHYLWDDLVRQCEGRRGGQPRIRTVTAWLAFEDLKEMAKDAVRADHEAARQAP